MTQPRDDGQQAAPARYMGRGRETIDRIRDAYGDVGALYFCLGNALKYRDRAGLKEQVDAARDLAAADWYAAMARHLLDPEGAADPRASRPDFVPYARPVASGRVVPLARRPGVAQERVLASLDDTPRRVAEEDRHAARRLAQAGLVKRKRAPRDGGPGAGQPAWLYWR